MKITAETLKTLSRTELAGLWQKTFKADLPSHIHKSYIIKYLLWQAEYDGLDSVTQKRIDKMVAQFEQTNEIRLNQVSAPQLCMSAGTKLIREFKGKKHEVIALNKGFEYRGETYKSLSAIANKITGTRWNGKVFFGVVR
jgi:hypothetical protein